VNRAGQAEGAGSVVDDNTRDFNLGNLGGTLGDGILQPLFGFDRRGQFARAVVFEGKGEGDLQFMLRGVVPFNEVVGIDLHDAPEHAAFLDKRRSIGPGRAGQA